MSGDNALDGTLAVVMGAGDDAATISGAAAGTLDVGLGNNRVDLGDTANWQVAVGVDSHERFATFAYDAQTRSDVLTYTVAGETFRSEVRHETVEAHAAVESGVGGVGLRVDASAAHGAGFIDGAGDDVEIGSRVGRDGFGGEAATDSGVDEKTGAGGSDQFTVIFGQPPSAAPLIDRVTDFDADDVLVIEQNGISYIGAADFTGTAGEVRSILDQGRTVVEVDADGDRRADETFILENGAFRLDATVQPTALLSLRLSVDQRMLAGTGAADQLTGNAGAEVMRGYEGDDTLTGNAGADRLFGGDGADIARGGPGGDYLSGGSGGDHLAGEAGDDRLSGGVGRDRLTGGGGADTFVVSRDDVGHANAPDTVVDFASADGDRVDFRGLDAVSDTPEVDAFRFVGGAAFSHQAGELRASVRGGAVLLFGDVDGDGAADVAIRLAGVSEVTRSDLILTGAASTDAAPAITASIADHVASEPVPAHWLFGPCLP